MGLYEAWELCLSSSHHIGMQNKCFPQIRALHWARLWGWKEELEQGCLNISCAQNEVNRPRGNFKGG